MALFNQLTSKAFPEGGRPESLLLKKNGRVAVQAYRLETVMPQNGQLQLSSLPFKPGEMVEIIILSLENGSTLVKQVAMSPRQAALAAIRSGKYARLRKAGEPLASEDFMRRKQEELALEERRWQR